jgi:hypothetical protein
MAITKTTNKEMHLEPLHDENAERDRTQKLAERYRVPFIDLAEQQIDPELFRSIPAELMFRYERRARGAARQKAED